MILEFFAQLPSGLQHGGNIAENKDYILNVKFIIEVLIGLLVPMGFTMGFTNDVNDKGLMY
jgi:hypothetical protein